MKRTLLVMLAVAVVAAPPLMAAEVDTIQIGMDKAYLYPDGRLRIPVYLTCSSVVETFGWGFTIQTNGQPVMPDSLVPAGRWNQIPQVMNLSLGNEGGIPGAVDSVCLLAVANGHTPRCIPAGSGVVCDAWFTGGALGDQLQISEIGTFQNGACWFDTVHVLACNSTVDPIPAVFVPTTLTIARVGVDISCASSVSVMTEQLLDLPVTVDGFGTGFSLYVASFFGPDGPIANPPITISGSNPFHVQWTPSLKAGGLYTLVLLGADQFGQFANKTVQITAVNSTLQGDTNCDGVIDGSDLARIVAYLTGNGRPPVCPGK